MTPAYAYVRVSGLGQMDGDGPERQSAAIAEFAKANHINILHEYVETYTGTELDRPVLQEVIAAVLANGVQTIVIEKLDRLARDIVIQENLIRDFQRHGITLLSTKETDLCSKDPTRVMIRQILGVMAEYERSLIVWRTKTARERIRKALGRCEGRKPYGDPKFPRERRLVDLVRNLHSAGTPLTRIAEQLNAQGLRTRKGTLLSATQIRRIVHQLSAGTP